MSGATRRRLWSRLLLAAIPLVAAVLFSHGCTGVTHSRVRMKVMVDRFFDPEEGIYPSLSDHIFAAKTRLTGILNAEKFAETIGFWIFLTEPHRSRARPVVLVNGHWTGPRAFRQLSESFDRDRFEPWFTYYPTGMSIKESARMLRKNLARLAAYYGQDEVVVVALSMGGLVARQALMPTDDGLDIPRVPLFIGVANPWAGTASLRRGASSRLVSAPSWKEFVDTSPYLETIYEHPLPEETTFHMIYGVGGNDDFIPGRDDGALSEASMARPEAVREAASVTIVERGTHTGVISEQETIEQINALLDGLDGPRGG